VARGFSGNQAQLQFLIKEAIQHANAGKGFAFLDVLSPMCDIQRHYAEWRKSTVDMNADKSFDPTNRALAFERVLSTLQEGKIPTGPAL